jgi:hypothetical protein
MDPHESSSEKERESGAYLVTRIASLGSALGASPGEKPPRGLAFVIFVSTALIVGYRAGWPKDELPVPGWAFPLVLLAWALVIVGSIMASGAADDDGV